jgi:hypothetical protein
MCWNGMRGKSLNVIRRRHEALTVKTVPKCECKLVSRPSRSSSARLSLPNAGRWASSFPLCHLIYDFQLCLFLGAHTQTYGMTSAHTPHIKKTKKALRAQQFSSAPHWTILAKKKILFSFVGWVNFNRYCFEKKSGIEPFSWSSDFF